VKKVFLDTNVVLDVIELRQPDWRHAAAILDLAARGRINAYVSAISIATIVYILEDKYHPDEIRKKVLQLLQAVESLPTSAESVSQSMLSDNPDIEDELQYFTASEHGCTVLTRDDGFRKAHPDVISPEEYLRNRGL